MTLGISEQVGDIPVADLVEALRELLDRLCIEANVETVHSVLISQQGVRVTYVSDTHPIAVTMVEHHYLTT
ncbi:MAG: hypothetical protein ACRD0W_10385 [Acidimicrobiales bacterium]